MLSRERVQERFITLAKIYSPSKGEQEICEWLMNYLKERNIEARIDEAGKAYGGNGGNITAIIPGNGRPLCFSAHLDQIEPCKNVNPIVEGDIIRTDGTTTLGGDDKAGVSAILEAVEDILESREVHREIHLLFTVTEEESMLGTKNLDAKALPCKQMIIADAAGPTGVIAYKAPAMEAITCTVHGVKAHAGLEPEKGINAIVAASKAISQMHIGRIDEETTSNIGKIEGGGATNIVTDQVTFTAEVRSHSMQKLADEIAHMENCIGNAAKEMNATYEFVHELSYPSFELPVDHALILETEEAMCAEGITPDKMIIGGGSDANILASAGCESVIVSVGMKDVHTVNETLDMNELWKATRFLRRMME